MTTAFVFADAGIREADTICPVCHRAIMLGDAVALCTKCGTSHHRQCLGANETCESYHCAPANRQWNGNIVAELRITNEELARTPLPKSRPGEISIRSLNQAASRTSTNKLAVAAFVCALCGIILFGPITGLVAVVLGSVAIGSIRASKQRGLAWAVGGIALGLADVVGWIILISILWSGGSADAVIDDFKPDPDAMNRFRPEIRRAMAANVVLEANGKHGGLLGRSIGSGVVLSQRDHRAILVTNRHVVDPNFESGSETFPDGLVQVRFIDQTLADGKVIWVAPKGVDLALVETLSDSPAMQTAPVSRIRETRIGDKVFAIGNPQHLDWTHTEGVISQFRIRQHKDLSVRIIQTQTAINPGNSGGGLYDNDGHLIGINTWTNDKRFSEGISFAIVIETLLELMPSDILETPGVTSP